jgi:molecular chaperone GrpE
MSKKDKSKQHSSDQDLSNATKDKTTEQVTDKEASSEHESDKQSGKAEQKTEPTAEEKINQLEQQLSEATEKYLRLFSEFDNFRKRSIKEKVELISTASSGVITALLPVVDDLERASRIASENTEKDPVKEGIILIYNKFKTILSQKGVEEIKTLGEIFDTDYHEAITHIPAQDEDQKGKIVDEVQKGYTLNGKIIRFARVVVAN